MVYNVSKYKVFLTPLPLKWKSGTHIKDIRVAFFHLKSTYTAVKEHPLSLHEPQHKIYIEQLFFVNTFQDIHNLKKESVIGEVRWLWTRVYSCICNYFIFFF